MTICIILKKYMQYMKKNDNHHYHFFIVRTPHLGLVRTWDGVCLNSVGCTRYFVGLI